MGGACTALPPALTASFPLPGEGGIFSVYISGNFGNLFSSALSSLNETHLAGRGPRSARKTTIPSKARAQSNGANS
jgi:hypothetical protein